jgi:hypothetical protein
VMAFEGQIVPIEVKAEGRGSLRSLHQFVGEKHVPLAVRLTATLPQCRPSARQFKWAIGRPKSNIGYYLCPCISWRRLQMSCATCHPKLPNVRRWEPQPHSESVRLCGLGSHALVPTDQHTRWSRFLKAHWECLTATDFLCVEVYKAKATWTCPAYAEICIDGTSPTRAWGVIL